MNWLRRLLHTMPGVHFYGPWQDINNPDHTSLHWHQKRYCCVCNRGQRRWTDSSGFL